MNKLPRILDVRNNIEDLKIFIIYLTSPTKSYSWKRGWKYGRISLTHKGTTVTHRIEQQIYETFKFIK